MMIMTLVEEEAPANFVPAAAVKRRGQVLFGMTGRKGSAGGLMNLEDQTKEILWRIFDKHRSRVR